MALIARVSQISGQEHTREVPVCPVKAFAWLNDNSASREMVHVAFPELDADDREFLMTGITPEEWDAIYPPEDEEEFA